MHALLRFAVATALVLAFGQPASADNWGSGAISGSAHRCTDYDDFDSECTPNNLDHLVYISPVLPDVLQTAFEASMADDYEDLIPELWVTITADSGNNDVRIYYINMPDSYGWAGTTCAEFATYNYEGFNRSCRPQLLYLNSDKWNSCYSLNYCRNWAACHEFGHTLGLAHAGVEIPDNHPNPDKTCMTYGPWPRPTITKQHDRDHIVECFPHPSGTPVRPPDCVSND